MSDEAAREEASERRLALRVGGFAVLALVACGVVVFLLGRNRRVFAPRVRLRAAFVDVQGLREGAPVRLSGVDVGSVARVTFARDRESRLIQVDLDVSRDALERIRRDSTARIGSQGLLGDKDLEISMGSPSEPSLGPGDYVATVPPPDINRLLEQTAAIFERTRVLTDRAATVLETLADPRTITNFQDSVSSLRRILVAAERGHGLVHALFYDRAPPAELRHLLGSFAELAARAGAGMARLEGILATLDSDGAQLLNQVARAAHDIGALAGEVKRSAVVPELGHAARDLAEMLAYMKSGQGTLGALLVDPLVYERLVTILGGVARSRVLRALVRFAIGHDEKPETAKVVNELAPAHPARAPAPPAAGQPPAQKIRFQAPPAP